MIARTARARPGITLTEILIAILIMGVGLISLATLFPLGLLRLREATRNSRAGLLYEGAADDMDTRGLLSKRSFTQTWYWTLSGNQVVQRDPFVQDAIGGSTNGVVASNPSTLNGTNAVTKFPLFQTGLPFCYDPLWRSITGVAPVMPAAALADPRLDFGASYVRSFDDARFGAGVFAGGAYPYLRDDPNPGQGTKVPSAWGLQRLTNFIPWSGVAGSLNYQFPFTTQNFSGIPQPIDVAGTVFASNDDIVFNAFNPGGGPNALSPLVPDTSYNPNVLISPPQADYRFTWFVTGHQVDAGGNGEQFTGEVVVCDGRPFGFDLQPGQNFSAPAGETVVEAIFGFGTSFPPNSGPTAFATATRTVLLRWPATLPDPQVKVGGWICDVTYEPSVTNYSIRSVDSQTPFARCYWYQVGKRTEPQPDTLSPNSNYRSMVLTLTSPVRDQTRLNTSDGTPVHVNAALVMPSVISVIPRAFEVVPIPLP